MKTLSVNPKNPFLVFGPRHEALAARRRCGYALWLRASGKVTELMVDELGQRRQQTWDAFRFDASLPVALLRTNYDGYGT